MQYSINLVNGGDQPIFDIALNTDNPAFTISPAAISLLITGKPIDGNGTIADKNRIQPGNDGIGYFTSNK